MFDQAEALSDAAAGASAPAPAGARALPGTRPATALPGLEVSPAWLRLSGTTLQWATGLFCAFVGAQMLVVPHHFDVPAYEAIRPNLALWGGSALGAGLAMLAAATTGGARALPIAAHLAVGVLLMLLAGGFALTANWFGTTIYGVVGAGTALAPWLARAPRQATGAGDLFAAVLGLALAATGLVAVVAPGQLAATSYESMRPYLTWHGASFVVCGLLVVAAQLHPRTPWWLRWLASLLLVGVVLVPMFGRALELQIWTGVALYGGGALVLVAAPWLGPLLGRIDPRSLRTRLAVTLASSSALALIVIVTINADREERSLRAQADAGQRSLATALAKDVADYVELHEGAARTLAAGPSLLDRPPEERDAWLRAAQRAYPSVVVFSLFDANGAQVARSDGRQLISVSGQSWFERIRATGQPGRVVSQSTTIQRPVFAYGAPAYDATGALRGVVTATIESSRIAEQLRQVIADPSQRAYLVDSRGRTIAHPDLTLIATFSDLSTTRPVGALLASDRDAGSLVYDTGGEEWLAGYARVPGLGWGVVVEQPTSVALASVRGGREGAFAALIVVAVVAALAGALAAGWLTAPLAMLSLAVRRLADGAPDARLGSSGITEIAQLAGAFAEMRERLAERTREHERSEAALRASDEHLRLALEAGGMGTWDWNVRTNELTWDGSLEEIHGLAPGSFDGRFETFLAVVNPDDREHLLATIKASLETRSQFHVDFRVVWPDGSVHWVGGLGRAYYDEHGAPVRMIGIGLEVTEQRRAVEVQRVLAEAGSQLVSSLDYATTLRGITQLVVTTLAEYCILEVQSEDGATSVEVAHADLAAAERARRLLDQIAQCGPVRAPGESSRDGQTTGADEGLAHWGWGERSILVPALADLSGAAVGVGSTAPAAATGTCPGVYVQLALALGAGSLICVPLLARGRTIGALTLIAARSGRRYDANDLALAEALAARAALAVDNARLYGEAQAAVRARDEFLSIASHELRTPVTGIKGYAQFLLRALDRNRLEPARLARSLRAIDEASDRLTALTQDLLDVSRIRLGQLPLRLEQLEPAELVHRLAERLREQLSPRHELVIEGPGSLPPIHGDADRLDQVLANLLDNAVKYSPDGGTVRVELAQAGEEVVIAVQDQGIGLPPDAAEAIFRPFGRARNATQRNLPGMGLGLYICRNIVERHGGRITAASAGEGLGTRFEIVLPSAASASSTLEPFPTTETTTTALPG